MFNIMKRSFFSFLLCASIFLLFGSCNGKHTKDKMNLIFNKIESYVEQEIPDDYQSINALLLMPAHPAPGEEFRVLITGGSNILKADIVIVGQNEKIKAAKSICGNELPFWRIDDFAGVAEGKYTAILKVNGKNICQLHFEIAQRTSNVPKGMVWKTLQSWDSAYETIYSAWINALFQGGNEQTSWKALHDVTRNKENNFLYNYLSLGEDDPESKNTVIMEPDCADNPFFLRAYFAWKLGLPFGYHISDRGWVGHAPRTGEWITNESLTSKNHPVLAFNSYIRNIMNGVHSGTARTAFDNENSDYYPVALNRKSLRPGTVFADPYGHTFVLISWIPQTKDHPGVLLAADAQPDKTVAIKRFWKGNFLFNTSEVIGEPGFKTFRPILFENNKTTLMKNEALDSISGFIPFSLQQRNMESNAFYHAMEQLINPKPLDPEFALMNLIEALHKQLLVRVKSVSTGEEYMKAHPGSVIPMPSSAKGVFQTGGLWEEYSTPNRDLRVLIAMDAVLNFPEYVSNYPHDFNLSKFKTSKDIKEKLQKILDQKVSELTISYFRSDGSEQKLTLTELLNRREALEMAYNPNDGIEIRWGAAENSDERATCKRKAPEIQRKNMQVVRVWFNKRLHPPT